MRDLLIYLPIGNFSFKMSRKIGNISEWFVEIKTIAKNNTSKTTILYFELSESYQIEVFSLLELSLACQPTLTSNWKPEHFWLEYITLRMQSNQSLLNEFGFTFGVAVCIAGFSAPISPVLLKIMRKWFQSIKGVCLKQYLQTLFNNDALLVFNFTRNVHNVEPFA